MEAMLKDMVYEAADANATHGGWEVEVAGSRAGAGRAPSSGRCGRALSSLGL